MAVAAPLEKMFGITELADLLSVSRRTVDRLRAAGKLPKPDAVVGTMPRWQPDSFRRWLADQSARKN